MSLGGAESGIRVSRREGDGDDGGFMDLSKISTARKLELMKSYIRERPKSGVKM